MIFILEMSKRREYIGMGVKGGDAAVEHDFGGPFIVVGGAMCMILVYNLDGDFFHLCTYLSLLIIYYNFLC